MSADQRRIDHLTLDAISPFQQGRLDEFLHPGFLSPQ